MSRRDRLARLDAKIILNKLLTLNLTLYHELMRHAETHNIPLPLNHKIINLVNEIEQVNNRLNNLNSPAFKSLKLPLSFFDDSDPEELPEPKRVTFFSRKTA